jgi:tetratricopeptide (TPR) repeat protein
MAGLRQFKEHLLAQGLFIIVAIALVTFAERASFPWPLSILRASHEDAIMRSKVIALNYQIPDFTPINDFIERQDTITQNDLDIYESYFKQVNDAMPDIPEVYYMLGFCAFYQGNTSRSIEYYKRSIIVNPDFFWSYYDLGLIFLKLDQPEKAFVVLTEGLKKGPDDAVKAILRSQVFSQIYTYQDLKNKNIIDYLYGNLSQGYQQARILLEISIIKMNKVSLAQGINIPDLGLFPLKVY